jgi:hypothetical protein
MEIRDASRTRYKATPRPKTSEGAAALVVATTAVELALVTVLMTTAVELITLLPDEVKGCDSVVGAEVVSSGMLENDTEAVGCVKLDPSSDFVWADAQLRKQEEGSLEEQQSLRIGILYGTKAPGPTLVQLEIPGGPLQYSTPQAKSKSRVRHL